MRILKDTHLKVFIAILVAYSALHLYTAIFGIFTTVLQRSTYLAFLLLLCFILYPATAHSPKERSLVVDWVFAAVAVSKELFTGIDPHRFIFFAIRPVLLRQWNQQFRPVVSACHQS